MNRSARDPESYSGVAARNPAITMAAITVNQMSSAGMAEIIAGLTHRIGSSERERAPGTLVS